MRHHRLGLLPPRSHAAPSRTGRDDRHHGLPRPGRRGDLGRPARGARPPAAGRHRPARRRAADDRAHADRATSRWSTAARPTTSSSCGTSCAAAGTRFRTDSDTEVVLHGYLEWGAGRRRPAQRHVRVRDLGRPRRASCCWSATGWASSRSTTTRPPTACCSAPSPRRSWPTRWPSAVVDADGLRELFAFVKTPGHAVWQGMHEVQPGHSRPRRPRAACATRTLLGAGRRRAHRRPARPPSRTSASCSTTSSRRQLISDVPLCTLLSGGLDSSAITALAARAAGRARRAGAHLLGRLRRPDRELPARRACAAPPDAPFVHDVARARAAPTTRTSCWTPRR